MKSRDRYVWHLRKPFAEEFDHSHWWKAESESKPTPIAAIYELARRHPRIGHLRSELRHTKWYGQELREPLSGTARRKMADQASVDLGSEPGPVHCLCLIGLKSWPILGEKYQEYWGDSVGKMKGVDCRDDLMRCTSIITEALGQLQRERMLSLKPSRESLTFRFPAGRMAGEQAGQPADPGALNKLVERLVEDLKINPIPELAIENAVAEKAIEAYRAGQWLFAIVPDLTHDDARNLLSAGYSEELKHTQQQKQRSRWNDWLPLISEFEDDELSSSAVTLPSNTVFTKYRRVLDGISFK